MQIFKKKFKVKELRFNFIKQKGRELAEWFSGKFTLYIQSFDYSTPYIFRSLILKNIINETRAGQALCGHIKNLNK